MKLAVFSDVHGNLAAFEAVLADAEALGVDRFVGLGDLQTLESVDRAIALRDAGKLEVCLLGNCDSLDPTRFNLPEDAVYWTNEQLAAALTEEEAKRWAFLAEAPRVWKKGEFLFVHGSPRNPFNEGVSAVDVDDLGKMAKLFALTPRYCFQGHTHIPGVFVEEKDGSHSYFSAEELDEGVFPLDERKIMANVGAVGKPLDGDPRPCYVVVSYEENGADNKIEFRRPSLGG